MTSIVAEREPTPGEISAYCTTVARYFSSFARETRRHLDDLDRRIAQINQVQFNLQAERGVALRRAEITQGVLSAVAELGRPDA